MWPPKDLILSGVRVKSRREFVFSAKTLAARNLTRTFGFEPKPHSARAVDRFYTPSNENQLKEARREALRIGAAPSCVG